MFDELESRLTGLGLEDRFSGVVHLQAGERTVYSVAGGWAHRGWGQPNRRDTRFRAASLGKMFTAVAVLQQVEAGRLSLDLPVLEVLDLQGSRISPEVTLFHLLTMNSGIADWFDESGGPGAWEEFCREHRLHLLRRNRDYLPLFVNLDPLARPGERYHYNGAGYILLGLVVEAGTGVEYEAYVKSRVFDQAGMDRSGFPALDDIVPGLAEGYHPVENHGEGDPGWRKNLYSVTPGAAADGGVTTTADDLIRFSRALHGFRLLGESLTHRMLTPAVPQVPGEFRDYRWMYGFGLSFLLERDGRLVRYGHTGEEDGVSCRFYHYPALGLDVVLLGNQSGVAGKVGWEIHDQIREVTT